MAFDTDDIDFAILIGDYRTPFAAGVSIALVLVCCGLVAWSADECSDRCSRQFDMVGEDGKITTSLGELPLKVTLKPEKGRVLDHECYCVNANGDLHVPEEVPRTVEPGVLRESP